MSMSIACNESNITYLLNIKYHGVGKYLCNDDWSLWEIKRLVIEQTPTRPKTTLLCTRLFGYLDDHNLSRMRNNPHPFSEDSNYTRLAHCKAKYYGRIRKENSRLD